jgi:hypothetical protein
MIGKGKRTIGKGKRSIGKGKRKIGLLSHAHKERFIKREKK